MHYIFLNSGVPAHTPDCLVIPYPYLSHLLSLDACSPSTPLALPSELQVTTTLFISPAWEAMLKGHPDACFTNFILSGIKSGFRIGFNYSRAALRPAQKNMRSAVEHPEVVDAYLCNETSLNRIVCLPPATLPWFQPNAFGVIPKLHKPGKWRQIVDLSSPKGHSVNDYISKEHRSIAYISIDDIANTVLQLGRGSLLAKADIQEAFHIIPVAPTDRLLLATQWEDELFLDKVLPFGLRSAPIIFTAVADTLEWVVRRQGVPHIFHYVEDYILVGKPNAPNCSSYLSTLLQTCTSLGVPIAPEKCEGPATTLTVLGIKLTPSSCSSASTGSSGLMWSGGSRWRPHGTVSLFSPLSEPTSQMALSPPTHPGGGAVVPFTDLTGSSSNGMPMQHPSISP